MSKISKQPPKKLHHANDNTPNVLIKLPEPVGISITELEVLETYMPDIIARMVACNDNEEEA